MAVRAPLYYDAGNLKEMTSAMVNTIVEQCVYQYSLDTSVSLTVVPSGGNVGSISDTRQQAGTLHTHWSSFPSEATTAEPTTVTVSYDKIQQTVLAGSPTIDTGWLWPAYKRSDNDIQPMTLQDVKDTFLHPAINLLTSSSLTSAQAGTYHISTATGVSGSTLVSSTPIFVNTQADPSQYTADLTGLGYTQKKSHASGGGTGTNTITMNNVNDVEVDMGFWRSDNSTLPDRATNPTRITSIDGNTLYLSNNKLDDIPAEVGNLEKLRIIYLNFNKLKELGCGYIISTVQINNDQNPHLVFQKRFEHRELPYSIYLYALII